VVTILSAMTIGSRISEITALGLALSLAIIPAVRAVLPAALTVWPTFRLMGRDYEAAVMSGGLCGVTLITAFLNLQ
jgi:sodium--glutamate symport carrier gltS